MVYGKPQNVGDSDTHDTLFLVNTPSTIKQGPVNTKRRHHVRRLVNAGFADAVAAALESGGVWRLATDWAAYGRVMRSLLDADDRFELASTDPAAMRPVTRFERKGLDVGRVITNLSYARR